MPRIFLFILLLLIHLPMGACASWNTAAIPVPLAEQVAVGDRYMGIRLLGNLRLPTTPINGLTPHGLSGLAWDEDAAILYALSDKGMLFHLRPYFQGDVLHDVQFVAAYRLQNAAGKPLQAPFADAEGLVIANGANGVSGDSELWISFEVKVRVVRYSPTGKWLGEQPLPKPIGNPDYYAGYNIALEAIALHDQWGLLLAPERSPQGWRSGEVPIFTLDGKHWTYPLYSAPNSSLVAMEALADHSLLTLERAFVSLLQPLYIVLRLTHLPENRHLKLTVKEVAVFATSQGWLLDNFEGLTHHHDHRFFIISDDNSRALQNTLLVYFELLPSQTSFAP